MVILSLLNAAKADGGWPDGEYLLFIFFEYSISLNLSINMASRPPLTTFCCCLNLATGSYFAAALTLIAGIVSLLIASTYIEGGEKNLGLGFILFISSGIVALLSSANLFVGVM